MKNETIFAIAAVLAVVLGIQVYMMFQFNDQLNQLTGQETQASSAKISDQNAPKPIVPKLGLDDDFFKGQSWDPYEEMQRMQQEMDQLFNESFSRFHLNTPLGSLTKTPEVDLQEKPDRYIVTVNAPGADESSISVKLEDQLLTISMKTEQIKEDADKKNDYQYRERFVGEFQRSITLPGSGVAAKMQTEYRNGVLTITIPKK